MTDCALVADIGGTHARFALAPLTTLVPCVEQVRTYADGHFTTLAGAARHYLNAVGAHPRLALLAVAGPLDGNCVRLTNRDWSFDRETLRRALDVDVLHLINDFAAVAWAVPHLRVADMSPPLQGTVCVPPAGPVTVIGAGTGLGVALLTGNAACGWRVVPTEGGHAGFAPANADQRRVEAWLRKRHGRASNERVLSGNGLGCIEAALAGAQPESEASPRPAADVVAAALLKGDSVARRALGLFCAVYGAVAGDMALCHGARTVLVAGGMAPHFLDFLRASDFTAAFCAKGRQRSHMQGVAVHAVCHANPGLLGAAAAAQELARARR